MQKTVTEKQPFVARSLKFMGCLLLVGTTFSACKKDGTNAIDTEYPSIDISAADAFPRQCSQLTRGQKVKFKARFSDNVELGSFSLDIHHNFDHHSHSTEVTNCTLEPVKTPKKPFVFIQSLPIAGGQKETEGVAEIAIPADVDAGDYHFLIRLTDKEGWQTIKGISITLQ